jgi:hypothetical protein
VLHFFYAASEKKKYKNKTSFTPGFSSDFPLGSLGVTFGIHDKTNLLYLSLFGRNNNLNEK